MGGLKQEPIEGLPSTLAIKLPSLRINFSSLFKFHKKTSQK